MVIHGNNWLPWREWIRHLKGLGNQKWSMQWQVWRGLGQDLEWWWSEVIFCENATYMFCVMSCIIFIGFYDFYWFENGEGVERNLSYTNEINFIVFIFIHNSYFSVSVVSLKLLRVTTLCVIFVLWQDWNCSVNFFFSFCASLSTTSWRRHASLIVEKIWAWKEWHTLPIHYLITEVQKIIVFVQNLYWMQLIIRSENDIFPIKFFPMLSNGFLLII